MLIVRAPLRISYAGGGTDLEAYFRRHGGLVVSATINRYFYVFISVNGTGSIQVTSSDYKTFFRHERGSPFTWETGELALPRAILHEFGVFGGVSIFLASEVPPGTGLGSSSSVAVAVVKALSVLTGREMDPHQIADTAAQVEIQKLGSPIGFQDQFAASYGGLNAMYFSEDGVRVEPVQCTLETRRRLEECTMLFFTGVARSASQILHEQRRSSELEDETVIRSLDAIKAAALATRAALERGDTRRVGTIMHESWQHKKRLATGISNPKIDAAYDAAVRAGALGGKVAGAGGGGFLLIYCEPSQQEAVTRALERHDLARVDFHFDYGGATVLVNSLPRINL
jgi:D-glycero-alpha-D-manno-heptose-7-phosphate kinase